MKKTTIIAAAMALLLHASCTDDTLPWTPDDAQADGVAFGISVVEQADLIYEYGRTRAAAGEPMLDSATVAANTFGAHPLEGDNAWGMNVHRMPLPMVGIHPGTASTDPEQAATRAPLSEIASGDLLFHDSLTIWGIVYDKEGSQRNLFNKTLLKKVRGWRSSVHWPYDDKGFMTFCAISPALESVDLQQEGGLEYDKTAGTLTLPTFKYKVPEEPGSQRDLLFGVSEEIDVEAGPQPGWGGSGKGYYQDEAEGEKFQHLGQDDKVIALSFRHILTAVRFAQGKMPEGIHIKRILLTGIVNAGTFQPQDGNGTWELVESSPSNYSYYTIYPDKAITDYSPSENVYIDGDSVLFLMPQTLQETSQLQVVLTVDAEGKEPKTERTLTCSLSDDVWRPGYTVTYKITIGELKGEYYLVLDAGTDGISIPKHNDPGTETKYKSGSATHETSTLPTTGKFLIHSFRNAKDYSKGEANGINVHQAAAWKMTGFSWTGNTTEPLTDRDKYRPKNRPAWLQSITGWKNVTSDVGDSDGENTPPTDTEVGRQGQQTIKYVLDRQSRTHQTTHSAVLAANHGGFDLSLVTPNGTEAGTSKSMRESANCYIVNATGNYKFPAVYGNSLQGSTVNSYTSPSIFKDHLGYDILYGNIYKQINRGVEELVSTENISSDPDRYIILDTYKSIYPADYAALTSDWQSRYDAVGDPATSYTIKSTYEIISKTDYTNLDATGKSKYTAYERWKKTFTKITYDKLAETGVISQELIWQDVDGLVTLVATASPTSYDAFNQEETGFGYVEFTVEKAQPGNAVIALKGRRSTTTIYRYYSDDACENQVKEEYSSPVLAKKADAEILWTWHIWVTDEVYPNLLDVQVVPDAITNDADQRSPLTKKVDELYSSYYNGSKIVQLQNADGSSTGCKQILPVNLGWVPDDDAFGLYQPRDTWVEIQLKDDPEQKIHFHIHQNASQDLITGTSTMYQWGRPTALPMVNTAVKDESNSYGVARSVWNAKNPAEDIALDFTVLNSPSPENSVIKALTTPTKMIHWNSDHWWNENANRAYWDTSEKTLYDPCPPGFQVPSKTMFAFMAMTDANPLVDGTEYSLNKWGTDSEKKGVYIYAKPHASTVPSEDRYLQNTYFATSGYYSGNTADLTMRGQHKDLSWGSSWTTNIVGGDDTKHAVVMTFGPQKETNGIVKMDKHVYVDALPIRPASITVTP